MCRGGHFCEIAGVLAHLISSPIQLEQEQLELSQTLSQNFMAQRVKTFREEGMILKRSPTGRTPTVTTDEKANIETVCSAESQALCRAPAFEMSIERVFSVQAELAKIQCAFTLVAIFQK